MASSASALGVDRGTGHVFENTVSRGIPSAQFVTASHETTVAGAFMERDGLLDISRHTIGISQDRGQIRAPIQFTAVTGPFV
jgi:hypothetical protein